MSNVLKALARGGAAETDPNFKQTVLLLHGDGTNGAQNNTFLDSSTNNFTITRNGNTTQGTFSPFSVGAGEWSNYFDGTGDYLTLADNAAFEFGSGDFTIESWVYATADSTNRLIVAKSDRDTAGGEGAFAVQIRNTNKLGMLFSSGSTWDIDVSGPTTVASNTWHHVAVTRSGTTFRLFLNGVLEATATSSISLSDNAQVLTIGILGYTSGTFVNPFFGYISNLRLVKGSVVSAYSTSSTTVGATIFTPPTTPLTNITNTSLLTCQSNRFVDNSTNAFAITRNGDVRVTPFSPFAPSAAYSASTNGGSGYFDGTSDTLSLANNAAFSFDANFTIEAWIYLTSSSSRQDFIGNYISSTNGWGIGTSVTNAGDVVFYVGNTAVATTAGSVWVPNSWNHIAVVRSSTTVTVYVNGVSRATGTLSGTVNNGNNLFVGATGTTTTGTSQLPITGYLSNVRIVKGTAVTPPAGGPTAPLTAITNTSLLCNFTNAGILDSTAKNNLETVGNAQIDTSVKKFGTGSMKFDGTGDYLKFPDAINFNVGEDFTVEAWLYMTDAGTYTPRIQKYASTTEIAVFAVQKSGTVYAVFSSAVLNGGIAATSDDATSTISGQTWNHVAWVRSSGTLTFYINGSASGTVSLSTYKSQPLTLVGITNYSAGGAPGLYFPFNGYIDDLRITKGVARYTANFTAPTKEFPDQ
jgi:hypothetical protein